MVHFTLLTYATHSHGMYDDLVAGHHPIVTGGWGMPWTGLMDKFAFVEGFAKAQTDDHVVVFVDGFDTRIVGDIASAVEWFVREGRAGLLVSHGTLESGLPRLFRRRIFGVESSVCCNTGMYMGYARDVARILARCRAVDHRGNDQRALELVRAMQDEPIRVDVERRVFCNLSLRERSGKPPTDAPMLGYNMTLDSTFVRKACSYIAYLRGDIAAVAVGLVVGVATGILGVEHPLLLPVHALALVGSVLADMVLEYPCTRVAALLFLGSSAAWNVFHLTWTAVA
jgi:hypothetical protein